MLYYAKNDVRGSVNNTEAVANPYVSGALFQVIWSEVEKSDGVYDWSELDRWIEPWVKADKAVAVRLMWSTTGYWPRPFYKTPTPRWVWEKGAVYALHEPSGTEIPLIWDPIYQKYAWRFMARFAERYGDHPALLFVDVTPGAETNPYRFGTINRRNPEFKDALRSIRTSDGRSYSEALWMDTLKVWIDASKNAFGDTPLLVTLNVARLEGPDRSVEVGQYCVDRGVWVGQNGLSGGSFRRVERGRAAAFARWSESTPLFFEMVHRSGGRTGTLMEVFKAAERIGASFVNVYPEDVQQGTRGDRDFAPNFEEALRYGHALLAGGDAAPVTQAPVQPRAGRGDTRQVSPRDREPTWLLPPVSGPNLHYKTFESAAAGEKVSYLIYLPPGYEAKPQKRYPVVYWLHGIGGSQQGVPLMAKRLTEAIEAGKAPPMLMVFVNGMIRSSYVDSKDGKTPVETVSIKELIPHIDATYRTVATRAGRMIEGFSMGGAGAAKWAFRHPDLFGSLSIIDGALLIGDPTAGRLAQSFRTVYGGDRAYYDAHDPWKLAEKNAGRLKGRMPIRIVTRTTGLGAANKAFGEHLARFGVKSEYHAIPDSIHSPNPLYEGLGDDNWAFYRQAFENRP
ncbi:MAG: alpha/beta hydrolase [Planctomycetota bacterium]